VTPSIPSWADKVVFSQDLTTDSGYLLELKYDENIWREGMEQQQLVLVIPLEMYGDIASDTHSGHHMTNNLLLKINFHLDCFELAIKPQYM